MIISTNRNPYSSYRTRNTLTPQSEAIIDESQIKNNAGGYAYQIDAWKQLTRFLILGTEGGTFYVGEQKLTKENAVKVRELINIDGPRVVREVVQISKENRAPKVNPLLFTLAMAISFGNTETKRAVIQALPEVARIGTHIFLFVEYATQFRGWGRVLREAVSNWYASQRADKLAYQAIKYQSRNGWSHRDLLRLSHAQAPAGSNDVYYWMAKGWQEIGPEPAINPLRQIWAFEKAKRATTVAEIVSLIVEYDLPRECIPTQFLKEKAVWDALLVKMPMTAMVRNLATMTRVGLLVPFSAAAQTVVNELSNVERVKASRIHPIQLLSAYRVYGQGKGVLSRGETFTPVQQVTQALQEAFYASFGNVEPTGKRTLLGLDTSGSMGARVIAGVPGLTPRDAAAVMAMVTARSEWSDGAVKFPLYHSVNFTTTVKEFPISPTESLEAVVQRMERQAHGGTDCAAPMFYALDKKMPVDTFIVYTDNETWAGRRGHPSEALDQYRQKTGIDAKLVVVGFTATNISIARPGDKNMLDVVGFDSATPALISSFSRGEI